MTTEQLQGIYFLILYTFIRYLYNYNTFIILIMLTIIMKLIIVSWVGV